VAAAILAQLYTVASIPTKPAGLIPRPQKNIKLRLDSSSVKCHVLWEINEKTSQFTTPYKDDNSKVAELKQQISQKMILLRSTLPTCHCAAK